MIKFKHHITNRNFDSNTFKKSHGTCACYEFDPKTNQLSFAITQCHKKDNYVKAKGRDEALDKFMKGHKITINVKPKQIHTLLETILLDITYNAH